MMKRLARLTLFGVLAVQSVSCFFAVRVLASEVNYNLSSIGPFTGSWKGKGQAIMKPGTPQAKTRKCSQITFQFDQDAAQFHLISGHYLCEDLDASYGSADFDVQGGALFYKGQSIGTISNQKVTLNVPVPEDGTVFHLVLTSHAGSLDYVEQWFQKGNGAGARDVLLLQVQGALTRAH
jgi:hypothetical protein